MRTSELKNMALFAGLPLVIILAVIMLIGGKVSTAETWEDTGIACISGHQNLALHIHPILTITVDGEQEPIPANLGVSPDCMAELHTHDSTGQIHVESVVAGKTHTLRDFLAVWDKEIEREGYTLHATVNGEPVEDPVMLTLRDHDQILLSYASATSTTATSTTE